MLSDRPCTGMRKETNRGRTLLSCLSVLVFPERVSLLVRSRQHGTDMSDVFAATRERLNYHRATFPRIDKGRGRREEQRPPLLPRPSFLPFSIRPTRSLAPSSGLVGNLSMAKWRSHSLCLSLLIPVLSIASPIVSQINGDGEGGRHGHARRTKSKRKGSWMSPPCSTFPLSLSQHPRVRPLPARAAVPRSRSMIS